MDKGKLYLVSVPLGNLKDITLRAIDILQHVDVIIAEDTRQAGQLLKLLQLPKKQLLSYRDQQHARIFPSILGDLQNGKNMALIADRGTPLISDPGYKLVRDIAAAGITISPIPGPSAAIAALTVSSLPTDKFVFLGFLPRTSGKQQKLLRQFATLPATFIIYESPFRVKKLLALLMNELGDIDIALAHELTKVNEEVITGKVSEVIEIIKNRQLKGEWIVLGRKA